MEWLSNKIVTSLPVPSLRTLSSFHAYLKLLEIEVFRAAEYLSKSSLREGTDNGVWK